MALVKYSGGVAQYSGSIGGHTYARNSSGFYVRTKSKPVNPNSPRQQAVRTALTALTTRWAQTLTAAQRAAWDLYASNVVMKNRLGEDTFHSGFNHYIRSNTTLARLGLTIVDDGPTVFELPGKDPTFAIAASEAAQTITVTYDDTMAWADENDAYMLHYQGKPQNPQRNFFDGPWRIIGYVAGVNGAPPASPKVQNVDYAIAETQRQWVYARILRADGRLSEPFRDDAFCAA